MPTISGTVYDDTGAGAAGRVVRAYRRDTGELLGQTTTGTGVATPGDSQYPSVSLLLHGNGSDGGTTILDNSASPKTATNTGVVTSTAQSKFDGASLSFSASDHRLVYAHDAGFQPTGDFCIEGFLRLPSVTGSIRVLVWKGTGTGYYPYYIYIDADGKVKANSYGESSLLVSLLSASSITANAFQHIAYDKNGSNYRLFMDGGLVASGTASGALYSNPEDPLTIGNTSDGSYGLGAGGAAYVDDFRITLGSRYTDDFTPPDLPFPNAAEVPASPVGTYALSTGIYTGEVQRIVLDDDAGTLYNDLIDRVIVA